MTIVVGVDGSASAMDAVRLAAQEAAWRKHPLRIVHAFIWPLLHVPLGPSQAGPPEGGLRHEAERLLTESASLAVQTVPSVKVETELIEGAPSPVLLGAARSAELVVLGDRGLGGFTGLLIGSVAVQVAAHSPVPVLVAKGALEHPGAVVLGADGSPASSNAVEYAFQEADFRATELVVVHTWSGPTSTGPGDMLPLVYDLDQVQAEEERVLAEALAGYRDRYPNVTVRQEVLRAGASRTLIRKSEHAQLVVVGSRGRGGFTGLLLGSVSQQVLHHSHCPVMIVPRKV